MAEKAATLSATKILTIVSDWYADLYPVWIRERMLIDFFNGGCIPTDREEIGCDDEPPVSLGMGYSYIKKPFDTLMDVMIQKPGFIKTRIDYPLIPARRGKVQSAIDVEINKIVHQRMESAVRRVAGRAIITGRAFLYRLSRWDWLWKTGRMLHPIDVTDDWLSESFRDWAFPGMITLRDIDARLDSTRDYEGGGWNRAGLANLKEYILKKNPSDDTLYSQTEVEQLMSRPFGEPMDRQPCKVYWYFRKNGERNEDGQEKVDLYCVSRWGQEQSMEILNDGSFTFKSVKVTEGSNSQLLYHLPNAFENIEECLNPVLLDSRVDGEQELAQIDGTGKIMIPRLQIMEQVALSTAEGITFGVQPNWTSAAGTALEKDELQRLQQEGLSPWDYIPPGLQILDKGKALTGLNAGMAMLQMMGLSLEQVAGTGDMPAFGQGEHGAKFKVQAQQYAQQAMVAISRRSGRFWASIDNLSDSIEKTMCRPLGQWQEADAGYYDVRRFQLAMFLKHQIRPEEYAPFRICGTCRRLSNDQDRQTTIQQGAQMLQLLGGSMSPQSVRNVQKEMARAAWGDAEADEAYPDKEQVQPDQVATAQDQTGWCLMALQPAKPMPGDNPMIHTPLHFGVLQAQMKALMQQGSATPAQQAGLQALLMHTAADAHGLPPQLQMQLQKPLMQMAMAIKKIPVSGSGSDVELKQQALELKAKQLQFSMQREGNLQKDRGTKLAQKDRVLTFNEQMQLRRFLEEQKNAGVNRASTMLDMINSGPDHPALPENADATATAA